MAILPVGPAETYTSVSGANAVASSADIIELRADITESFVTDKQIAGIRSDATKRTWTSDSGADCLSIPSGLTNSFFIENIIFEPSGTNAGGIRIQQTITGTANITVSGCDINLSASNQFPWTTATVGVSSGITIKKCVFDGGGSGGGLYASIEVSTAVDSVVLQNNIFKNFLAQAALFNVNTNGGVSSLRMENCTFDNNGGGFWQNTFRNGTRGTFRNNLFTNSQGGQGDFSNQSEGNTDDFVNCGFGSETGPFGTDNIFTIVANDEYVDASGENFQLKSTAQSRDAGVTTSFNTDIIGTLRPQGSAYDIGAYEFIVALVPSASILGGIFLIKQ